MLTAMPLIVALHSTMYCTVKSCKHTGTLSADFCTSHQHTLDSMALQMRHLTDANTNQLDHVTEAEESKGDVQEQIRLFQHRLQETTADNQALHEQIDVLEKQLNVGAFSSWCVFPVNISMVCPVCLGLIAFLLSAP